MNDALATVQNVVSAVTCSFRIDDTIYAKTLLEKYIGIIPINNELLKESQKKRANERFRGTLWIICCISVDRI